MELEKFDPDDVLSRYSSPVIIVMKGLPCTAKTDVAIQIGRWAKCPVLSIDNFIGDEDDGRIGSSWEEAERLQATVLQQAFTTLCRVARFHLDNVFNVVVIKSRLCSTFELEKLMQLGRQFYRSKLLIVECGMRNKHQWNHRFKGGYPGKWYGPRSWNDMEKATVDHYEYDTQARANWDRHLLHLIQAHAHYDIWPTPTPLVRRLVVDPYSDLGLTPPFRYRHDPNPIFVHAINYLLTADYEKLNCQNPYVVEFDEFRRSRENQFLNAPISSTRGKAVCRRGGCLFKYLEELRGDELEGSCCELCEEKVVSGEPAYACHFCILTLHKSCVELINVNLYLDDLRKYGDFGLYMLKSPGKNYACKGCVAFRGFCDSCHFQTLLKRRLVPPVVRHDHHPHSLSLILYKDFVCKACGVSVSVYDCSYVCKVCEWYYHILCINMPRELKHGHGGHEHVLKLKYTQDDMEREDYWCEVCYEDLDPYLWFYSCQSCPYYAAHLYCAGVYPRRLWELGVYR